MKCALSTEQQKAYIEYLTMFVKETPNVSVLLAINDFKSFLEESNISTDNILQYLSITPKILGVMAFTDSAILPNRETLSVQNALDLDIKFGNPTTGTQAVIDYARENEIYVLPEAPQTGLDAELANLDKEETTIVDEGLSFEGLAEQKAANEKIESFNKYVNDYSLTPDQTAYLEKLIKQDLIEIKC